MAKQKHDRGYIKRQHAARLALEADTTTSTGKLAAQLVDRGLATPLILEHGTRGHMDASKRGEAHG